MFRLVVLSAFVAVAFAAPSNIHHDVYAYSAPLTKTVSYEPVITGYEKTVIKPELTVVEQPTVHHVGNIVKSVPTAVSHQSSTVVHSKADYVEPIIAHGVSKTIIETPKIEKHYVSAPVLAKTVVEHAPLTKAVYASAPAYAYSAPLAYDHLPLTYAAHHSPAVLSHAW